MSLRKLILAAVVLCVLATTSLSAQDKPIVFAIAGDGLTVADREPLRAYLTKEMGREVKLVVPDSYPHTAASLGDVSIDFPLLVAVTYFPPHPKITFVPL